MHIPDASGRELNEAAGRSSGPKSDQAEEVEEARLAYWRAASPVEHARVMRELSDRALEDAKLQGQQPDFKSLPSLSERLSRNDGVGPEGGTEKHVGD
jgi:hypothetical protein